MLDTQVMEVYSEEDVVALKRAVDLDSFEEPFTWSWCTWLQPWFPQTQRAWPAHQAAAA